MKKNFYSPISIKGVSDLSQKTTFAYDHYYTYSELTGNLRQLAQTYPGLAELTSLAVTPGGRDIWLMSITDSSTGPCEEKPAYYCDGNHHAGEVTGSMAAFHFADYLLTNSAEPETAALLKKYAFYIIPRMSPDGAECYLTTPTRLRSVDRMYPYETEQPGLQQKDMDGDGVIRTMRVKTPYGAWKVSKKDPRLMALRAPDDSEGDFYNLYTEGEIVDFDGINIQPAPDKFGNDLNRNYPVSWSPESVQKGAGVYPLSNIETRTLADFVISHKNIASVITFHTHGGMFLYPPGMVPSSKVFQEDVRRYKEIGKIATAITGFDNVNIFDEFTPVGTTATSGAFDDYCHYDRGIPAYTVECWDIAPRSGVPHTWPMNLNKAPEIQEEEAYKQLMWVDANVGTDAFVPWHTFQHPQLGEVEIGGYDYKYTFQNCPPKFLREEVEKHTAFMLRHVRCLPSLRIDEVKAEPVGVDVYRVSAVVGNAGYLPTYLTREAVKLKVDVKPTAVLTGAEVVYGSAEQVIDHLQGYSGISARYVWGVPGTGVHEPVQRKVSWLVRAKAGQEITVSFRCPSSGRCSATVTV